MRTNTLIIDTNFITLFHIVIGFVTKKEDYTVTKIVTYITTIFHINNLPLNNNILSFKSNIVKQIKLK